MFMSRKGVFGEEDLVLFFMVVFRVVRFIVGVV